YARTLQHFFDSAGFTILIKGQVANKVQNNQIWPWLTDDMLCLLRANNVCLSNRTYRIAPHLLYQALVIMTFDHAMWCFVPC
ncbi:hypothetical protein MXB_1596, partial [Myxobolus squamalis]